MDCLVFFPSCLKGRTGAPHQVPCIPVPHLILGLLDSWMSQSRETLSAPFIPLPSKLCPIVWLLRNLAKLCIQSHLSMVLIFLVTLCKSVSKRAESLTALVRIVVGVRYIDQGLRIPCWEALVKDLYQ